MASGIGSDGIVEIFLPPGGTAGQALVKIDTQNYNATWGAGGGGGGVGSISAGGVDATGPRVIFSNSNGVSFGVAGNVVTASVPAVGGAQTGISGVIVSNTTYTSGTISFSNANGISFGSSAGQAITASYTVPVQTNQSAGIYASSQTFGQSSSSTHDARSLTVVGSGGVSVGWSNSSLLISGQTTIAQSVQTQASGNIAGSGFTSGGAGIGLSGTLNSNGLSLSATVPTQTNQSAGIYASSQTFGQSSSSTYDARSLSVVGSGAVSVGWSNSSLLFSVPVQSVQTQASGAIAGSGFTSAGANIGLSGTHNSAGLSLSATVPAQSNQSAIKGLGASNTGNTAGNTGISSGIDWVIAGSNNITISESTVGGGPNTLWVSGPSVAGAQTGISGIIVSNTTYTSGTVSFSNANGISFGSSAGQAITASYTVPTQTNQSAGIYASSQTFGQSSSSTHDARSLTIVGSGNISVGWSNSSLLISGAAGGGNSLGIYASSQTTGQSSSSTVDSRSVSYVGMGIISVGLSGGSVIISGPDTTALAVLGGIQVSDTTYTSGTVTFQNANGISFGSSGANGVSASYTVPTQTNQTVGIYASSQTTGASSSFTKDARSITVVGAGLISVGWSNSSLIISGTAAGGQNPALSANNGSFTYATASFSNLNNVSFVTAAGSAIQASYALNVSATGGTSNALSGLTFKDSNGVSFGLSTGAGIGTITASVSQSVQTQASGAIAGSGVTTAGNNIGLSGTLNSNGLSLSATVAAQTNQSIGFYGSSQTTGSASSGTLDARSISIIGAGIVSVGMHSTSAGGTTTGLVISATQSNQAASASNGSFTFQTLNFSNANNVTFGTSAGGIVTASVVAGGGANFTAFATSNTTQSSTGVLSSNSMIFAGAGGVSVGVSNGSVVISGGAGAGGGIGAGVSTMGNTAGSTGTVTTGNVIFVGSGAMTLSQSTGAAGSAATITFSVPQTSSLAGSNGITLSTNGSTISVIAPYSSLLSGVNGISISTNGSTISISGVIKTNSWWQPEVYGNTSTMTFANNTVYFRPIALDGYYAVNNLMLQGSASSSNSTASFSGSLHTSAAGVDAASSGTGQYSFLGTVLLFSRFNTNETHASFNNIQTFYSNTYSVGNGYSASVSWHMSSSSATVSVTTKGAVSYIANVDTAGNITTSATTTSGSTTFSSTSTNAQTISSSFILSFPYAHRSGFRPIYAPMSNTIVSPGQYWIGLQQSTAIGSTNMTLGNVARIASENMLIYTISTNSPAEIGNSVLLTSSNWRLGFGSHSGSNQTTTTMGLTAISSLLSNASIYLALNGNTR